jgi:hypothetical protein
VTEIWESPSTAPQFGKTVRIKLKDDAILDAYYEPHELFWDKPWVICGTIDRVHVADITHWSPATSCGAGSNGTETVSGGAG